jgi:hypothetical protein
MENTLYFVFVIKVFHENLKKSLLFTLAISTILVVASLLIPVPMVERAENTRVEFGYPLNFVTQEQYAGAIGYPEGPSLPYPLIILSPWENPTQIRWIPLLANLVSVSSCVILVYRPVILIRRNNDQSDHR